ncbi:10726_t:CDS:2 [Paraglomus brasilianum]|uniref:10726_t:CDS:1 n=1 Tax=Paraglomus brasilianum TaxID=144538 RepID=A0A9N9DC59_9GLOM|nr:10726_t:CDS:2 [Paraglomus brasilianum]
MSDLSFWSLPDVAKKDFRVVVGIDFGTTFSGFAFANKANPDQIETQDTWPEQKGQLKTNTVLQYDNEWKVSKWGNPALAERPKKKKLFAQSEARPVELFKLHLGNMANDKKPRLPKGLDYRKAITDYLRKLNESITETVQIRWPKLDYHSHVIKIMTVPAEYDEKARHIMRTCAFEAGIINNLNSEGLEFTSEPEAAAIYCMRVLKEHNLNAGSTFLVVDCGGGTVDLTTRTLLADNKLSEITERTGDFCGSTYVDREFIKYIASVVGKSAVRILEEKHYTSLQYMIQQFCARIKFEFDGDSDKFNAKDFDIEEICPVLMQYVQGEEKERMEEAEWMIELDYETVKSFFDPIVDRVLQLIKAQLEKSRATSAIFLVGGFSDSMYLLQRIRSEFSSKIGTIAVPAEPIAAVIRGAVYYGLDMGTVTTRVLKRTYGIEVSPEWKPGDPPHRRTTRGRINVFKCLAQRGMEVPVDSKFGYELVPSYANQTQMKIDIYTTYGDTAKYCDDSGMELFGQLSIELPDTNLGLARPVDFSLTFGKMEVKAQAKNKLTGKTYEASFALEL